MEDQIAKKQQIPDEQQIPGEQQIPDEEEMFIDELSPGEDDQRALDFLKNSRIHG